MAYPVPSLMARVSLRASLVRAVHGQQWSFRLLDALLSQPGRFDKGKGQGP